LKRDLFVLIVDQKFFSNQEQWLKKLKQIKMDKLQEMQILEQTLQNLLMQKQAFQMELSETDSAIEELKKSGEEVYKIIGQLMIKSGKKKIEEELLEKKKLLELRLKNIEKQEESMTKDFEQRREEFFNKQKKQQKK
jgi:prefoldin beta subunit